ncbi:DUF4834 family protein [[Flexibacter] sp. ATCC 35208]|uniref:DUF4834 family protein n=1 Tax=[Flexibacter] sp. ATCC 35208 TaxID=1936242 RepID=UPI0009C79E57|nr:DUF4834 family protein [[Flexibacter] sp. ATCC 35208]OMP79840.1 hypothetical protein BW716_07840 [[Flexibacter] sp. ATCC 35208]
MGYICTMFKIIFLLFICYILYKFVFNLVLPMYQTARQVRRQMGDIQDRMRQQYEQEQQYHQQQQPNNFSGQQQAKPKIDKGDYLDFEDVK